MKRIIHLRSDRVIHFSWSKKRKILYNIMYRNRFDWMLNLGRLKIYLDELPF